MLSTAISRRHLPGGLAAAANFQPNETLLGRELRVNASILAITRGPRFHWRGYYDKFLFDVTNRCVLATQVESEGRSPTATDAIRVGVNAG